jgi:hypothetical protein
VKPQSIGRTLGIGLRVAGRIAGQRVAAGAQAGESQAARTPSSGGQTAAPARQFDPELARAAGKTAGKVTRGAARGVGGFLKPFRRVGGILWLEVTGVVFFLPVAVFGPVLWKTRLSWAHGPDHRTFLITAAIVVLFLYLSLSSFWRARRK